MEENSNISPSQKVYRMIKEGKKIEAIKILREESGLGLKEAKDFIEKFESENYVKKTPAEVTGPVLEELKKGSKIEAIKKYREATGMGLKDSKEMVEKIIENYPEVKRQMDVVNKEKLKKTIIFILIFGLAVLLIINLF